MGEIHSIAADLIARHASFPGKVVITGAPMFDHDVQDQRALPGKISWYFHLQA